MNKKALLIQVSLLIFVLGLLAFTCKKSTDNEDNTPPTRLESLPDDAVKQTPMIDNFPPVMHSELWGDPIPMPGPVNTAGAEDSPFITNNDDWFFFFFTPDLNIPAEQQLLDQVTGIWWSKLESGTWTEPERIILNNDIALDGAPFVQRDSLWFASARVGNYRPIDFYIATYNGHEWGNVVNAGQRLNEEIQVGELCLSSDGRTIYYGTDASGGYGGYDLWKTEYIDGEWADPVNLGPDINSAGTEYQPFITADGGEIWFTGQSHLGYTGPAIFRSINLGDTAWSAPEEIISNFAGEPSLDSHGNIYFVHHFATPSTELIEADIYVAYKVGN